jgi:hypothetical protein
MDRIVWDNQRNEVSADVDLDGTPEPIFANLQGSSLSIGSMYISCSNTLELQLWTAKSHAASPAGLCDSTTASPNLNPT